MYFNRLKCAVEDRQMDEFDQTEIENTLWKCLPPIIVVVGTIGNILSIVVLNRRKRFAASTSTYLSALAVCDILILYTGLVQQWLKNAFHFDVRSANPIVCKLHFYLSSFSLQFSSWILVVVTIERLLSVWKPHTVKIACTKKLAVYVLLAQALMLAVLNSHLFLGITHMTGGNGTMTNDKTSVGSMECKPNKENLKYVYFMAYVWPWIDLCIVFLLPFLILLFGNVVILVNIKRSRRFQRGLTNYQTSACRVTLNVPAKMTSLTAMLLTLNSVFFVCIGPASVFNVGQFYWWPNDSFQSDQEHANALLTWAIVNVLMYTNYAINFLLYIMCGTAFREEVKLLFKDNMCETCKGKYSSAPAINLARLTPMKFSFDTASL